VHGASSVALRYLKPSPANLTLAGKHRANKITTSADIIRHNLRTSQAVDAVLHLCPVSHLCAKARQDLLQRVRTRIDITRTNNLTRRSRCHIALVSTRAYNTHRVNTQPCRQITHHSPEISPNNRAGCSASHCKAEGVKILKGEIRQGVMVMFQEKQSWKYRHWYA